MIYHGDYDWPPITADTLRTALTATHHADDKTALDRGLAGCGVDDCGDIRCTGGCGERLMCTGPLPVPRCIDHPCCEDCADDVTCTECCLILAERAQDRAADLAYDVARES